MILRAIGILLFAIFASTLLMLCTACAATKLSALSQQRLLGAERANAAIIERQDGGMPRADRILAMSAYCVVDGVLHEAKVAGIDASIPCK
jgi:hypothetical protein